MTPDPSVIAALAQAVEAAPDNGALRAHLATLLLEADRPSEALEHCVVLIAARPDDVEALRLAARAAREADDPRAESYARLASALGGTPEPQGGDVVRLRAVGGADPFDAEVEESPITLKDVAGMEAVKRRLNIAFLAPMRNPEMRRMYGKQLRGGLLLYGPPGCGKTFVAKAVAGELGAKFIAVGLPDVLNLYIGESERNLHEIFETARANTPCVLFFDELDALGRKRSLMRHSSERNVINQLLADLDSVGTNNEGLFVLAATNHPWDVDAALRRPGRFDRTILVTPPDRDAREAILRATLKKRPADGVDIPAIAALTENFSGADVVHLCESATEYAMEDSLESGTVRAISTDDFRRALKDVQPSTRSWMSTARNYAEFANDGGAFDELAEYLRKQRIR
ncbi:MAG TPA: ATP-binding protein [Thermoanaerobaculia bacterium]